MHERAGAMSGVVDNEFRGVNSQPDWVINHIAVYINLNQRFRTDLIKGLTVNEGIM